MISPFLLGFLLNIYLLSRIFICMCLFTNLHVPCFLRLLIFCIAAVYHYGHLDERLTSVKKNEMSILVLSISGSVDLVGLMDSIDSVNLIASKALGLASLVLD